MVLWKGLERKSSSPNRNTIPESTWKDSEKLRKSKAFVAGVITEILTGHLPGTRCKGYNLSHFIRGNLQWNSFSSEETYLYFTHPVVVESK